MHLSIGKGKIESIPFHKTAWRKLVTFLKVTQKEKPTVFTPESFKRGILEVHATAQAAGELSAKTISLWKLESAGVSLVRHGTPGFDLRDPEIHAALCPILHVGLGAGAVEKAEFDWDRIQELVKLLGRPEYAGFAYESLGAMLALYEPGRIQPQRALLGLVRLERPDPAELISSLPEDVGRLISHGYGRLLYFKSKDIRAAVRAASKLPFLDLHAAVEGTAFAFSMVNNRDVAQVLETGDKLQDESMVRSFRKGLFFAILFWEWTYPGTLNSIQSDSPFSKALIKRAASFIESRRQNSLPPFGQTGETLQDL
jgi:hypothetical protein